MNPSLWTDAFLDSMRLKGDEEADAAVECLYEDVLGSEETFRRINALLYQLTFEGELDVTKLPGPVRAYAEQSARLPDWADAKLIDRGQQLFFANGLGATVLLLCASLPECYVMRNGVQVLGLTTYLSRRPRMRILETSQMVRDAMTPGQLVEGGAGVLATQKVRLLHAAVRHLILSGSHLDDNAMGGRYAEVAWRPEWGHPICQEDMAYTLQTFGYVVVRGLQDLGVNLHHEDREAYIHCWNVVGHILGIERELIPEPEPQDRHSRWELAGALYETSRKRQEGKTEEGQALTGALVELMEEVIANEIEKTRVIKYIGGRKLRYVPVFLMRHLLGTPTLDLLGVRVPQANLFERGILKLMLSVVRRGERAYQRQLGRGSFLRASVVFHEIVTAHLSRLPADHKQNFLPEHVRREVQATGRRPFEVIADRSVVTPPPDVPLARRAKPPPSDRPRQAED